MGLGLELVLELRLGVIRLDLGLRLGLELEMMTLDLGLRLGLGLTLVLRLVLGLGLMRGLELRLGLVLRLGRISVQLCLYRPHTMPRNNCLPFAATPTNSCFHFTSNVIRYRVSRDI